MSDQNMADPFVLLLLEQLRNLRGEIAEQRSEFRAQLAEQREESRIEIQALEARLAADIKDLRKGLNVFNHLMSKVSGAWWVAGMLVLAIAYVFGLWDKLLKLWP